MKFIERVSIPIRHEKADISIHHSSKENSFNEVENMNKKVRLQFLCHVICWCKVSNSTLKCST